MRKALLAAAAMLSLGAGASFAASSGPNRTQPVAATTATTPAAVAPQNGGSEAALPYGLANPWDGTESWAQWNKDHPLDAGD